MTLPLTLKRGAPAPAAVVAGLDGVWRGALRRDGRELRLILHVLTGAQGTRVTLDSPDLGAFGLPVEALTRTAEQVSFRVPTADVAFTGTLDAAAGSLRGGWSRSGQAPAQVEFRRDSAPVAQHACWATGGRLPQRPIVRSTSPSRIHRHLALYWPAP
jgi:hypothetical protein